MQPEVTLTLRDKQGRVQTLSVSSSRFTIGRDADNDLIIDDTTLSRRHALIECFEGMAQVSDCGSQNGTLLNGRPLSQATLLGDGDVISFGSACEITVNIGRAEPTRTAAAYQTDKAFSFDDYMAQTAAGITSARRASRGAGNWIPRLKFSPTMVAVIATVMIPVAAGIAIFMLNDNHQQSVVSSASQQNQQLVDKSGQNNRQPDKPDKAETLKRQIEQTAKEVMARISDGDSYVFEKDAINDISEKVAQYRATSAALGSALRSVNQRREEITAQAKRKGIRPALVAYAALAETSDEGAGRDAGATALGMIDDLVWLQTTFGSDANSSLIVIAAYKMGVGTKKSHPLLSAMTERIKNPDTDRNVWFLYKVSAIKPAPYNFVVKFLALAIIAQDPPGFDVQAPALKF
jgi:predicted component of type VI protein secretion system